MSKQQKWVIKDSRGRVRGPYTTSQVIYKITNGDLSGEEFISEYPGSNWSPISQDPQFYDKLLEVLSGKAKEYDRQNHTADPDITKPRVEPEYFEEDKVQAESSAKEEPEVVNKEKEQKKKVKSKASRIYSSNPEHSTKEKEDDEVIELKDESRLKKEAKKMVIKKPIIFLVSSLILLLIWLFSPTKTEKFSRLHLKAPSEQGEKLTTQQLKQLSQKSVKNYLSDTYQGYVNSQAQTVKLIEAYSKSPSNWALLCLNYLELWPYAYQDNQDQEVVRNAVTQVNRLEPDGVNSSVCKAIDLFIQNRVREADSVVRAGLLVAATDETPPIALYYLKARVLNDPSNAKTAIGYVQSAQELWPGWTRAKSLEAELYEKSNNYSEAANIYAEIYKKNPNHIVSGIELGVIQHVKYNQAEKAMATLSMALKGDPKAPNNVLAKGYLSLAQMTLDFKQPEKALDYAKKAYYYNPSDVVAKNLMIQIGGKKAVKSARADTRQLISEGNYFYRSGDYITALASYRTAYELNPKSGIAAMKAGKCAWEMSFPTNAIKWLNLAITADHKLVEAYVTLADYYAQRYDFASAAQILTKVNEIAPKNFEVFRGFALVEFRRNAFESAIGYVKKALKMNNRDVASRVLYARSNLALRKFPEAFTEASLAIEQDMNNREAQTVYAQAMAGVEGIEAGLGYLRVMVKSFPLVLEYRLALADMYAGDEQYDNALQIYNDIIQIDEKSKLSYIGLGRVQKALGNSQKSLDAFLRASIIDPSDVEPAYQIGLLYLQIGKFRLAKKQFEKILKLNKRYPLIHYYLGQTFMQLKDYKAAIEQAHEERVLNPNLPESYTLAASAYFEMEEYGQCAREYQTARSLQPESASNFLWMSRCYRLSGNLDIAIQMLNRAAQIESGLAEIYKEQGAIFETKGDMDSAIKSYEKYLVLDPAAKDRQAIERRINELQ